jgi:hypothetical protein
MLRHSFEQQPFEVACSKNGFPHIKQNLLAL